MIVGIEVGGTFTDLFHFDEATGKFRTGKVPSNRGDEAVGFLDGLKGFGAVADLASIVHGTTVGTNALLERKGARVGLITTAGFRDVLEMRRRDRRATWGLTGDFTPVVERDFRLEVDERTLASGEIRVALDPAQVREAAARVQEWLREGGDAGAEGEPGATRRPDHCAPGSAAGLQAPLPESARRIPGKGPAECPDQTETRSRQ